MMTEIYADIQICTQGMSLSDYLDKIDSADVRVCATAEDEDDKELLARIARDYKLAMDNVVDGPIVLDCLFHQFHDHCHQSLEPMTFTDECGNDVEALRRACHLAIEEDDTAVALKRISETFGITVKEIEQGHADILYPDHGSTTFY